MEPTKAPVDENTLRLRLVLGKFQVSAIDRGLTGLAMTLSLPNGIKIRCDLPILADVRLGDWLTIYTEVLADPNKLPPPPPTN